MCRKSRASTVRRGNVPHYPPADYRGVSEPNADTLYSVTWLDLTEPQVFSHPDMGDRFYLFEVTDLWMSDSQASPSKRTACGQAASYLFTGPGWKGELPSGLKHFPIATRYMVILDRTYADGTVQDYKAVNALQAQHKITPLSAWGKPYTPVTPPLNLFSMTDKPQTVILAMGAEGYFNLVAKLMGGDAPAALRASGRTTAIATLNRQRHFTPSCGGFTPTAERTVGRQGRSSESLTPRPGIREQNLPGRDIDSVRAITSQFGMTHEPEQG
jgi:hypothetical protein